METNESLRLQKPRSISAVIRDGYRLYTGHFKRLFRASWIVATVYALCFALMMNYLIDDVLSLVVTISTFGWPILGAIDYQSTLLMGSLRIALFVLSALALASYAFGTCAVHRETGQIERPAHWYGTFNRKPFLRLLVASMWLTLLLLVVCALFGAIIYGVISLGFIDNLWKSLATMALLVILACIVAAFLLPLAYPVVRFVVSGTLTWRPPFSGYALGLRHWNLLFVCMLMVAIVTITLTVICELPAFIIGLANAKAYAGAAIGDPLNLPEHMMLMTTTAFVIAGFVQAYVHLYSIFPLYYAYGSIEQWRMERQEMINRRTTKRDSTHEKNTIHRPRRHTGRGTARRAGGCA